MSFRYPVFIVAVGLAITAHAFSLDSLSGKDAVGGLKEALTQGAGIAVASLGKTDGFLGNDKVRIPLPENLEKAKSLLRGLGAGKQVDELETAMNRAAEAAVPEARTLLVNAVKQMSIQDAKGILTGGDDAATQYFRKTTAGPLAQKFQPIVQKAMARVKLAEKYDQFAGKAARLGLIGESDAHLDSYVTGKALDGLYLMIAEEEKQIRQNPADATGRLAQKVFGLLR
ncbi:MAG: DUF4197 domain-containing protein [Proteobacteria bacterium]|nr:DUF4197 domain-containing protein [Pseudomonadota bacterium]HQR03543.1 DUF4197 domain-containing protein [Rhodocyclaceae bacterium]